MTHTHFQAHLLWFMETVIVRTVNWSWGGIRYSWQSKQMNELINTSASMYINCVDTKIITLEKETFYCSLYTKLLITGDAVLWLILWFFTCWLPHRWSYRKDIALDTVEIFVSIELTEESYVPLDESGQPITHKLTSWLFYLVKLTVQESSMKLDW